MEEKETSECKHDGRFAIKGTEFFGFCTCAKCGREVDLGTPLSSLIERMQDYEEKIRSLLSK